MSQFVKPVADKLTTSWTGNNVGGSNLYQEVDETVASTDDFTSYDVATAAGNSDGPVIVWKVTSVGNPSAGTATIRLRTYASQTATYILEIRSGYVDESNKGTLLGTSSTQSHPGDGAWHTLTDSAVTFAGGGTGSDLYFRLKSHATSASSTTIAVTAVDADLPDAGISGSGTAELFTQSGSAAASGLVRWIVTGTAELFAQSGIAGASGVVRWIVTGTAELFAQSGIAAASGRAAWILTGTADLSAIFIVQATAIAAALQPGDIVTTTVDGVKWGGLVIKQFDDFGVLGDIDFVPGATLVAIHIVYDHGRWRWGREVIVTDAIDVSKL